jgi:two-component system, cell cycle sensor histidine kinase and response regulator CckA
VDDEEDVLHILEMNLKRLQFEVISTNDPLKAVEIYSQNQNRIDLVMIDSWMPGMNGIQLLQSLKQENANVRAMLCTGDLGQESIQSIKAKGFHGHLPKPFTIDELTQQLTYSLTE